MIVEGTFTFAGPRETVWDLLQDPDVLVKALPGAKELSRTGEDEYEGVMHVGVGPVTAGMFSVKMSLTDKVAPERYSMQIDGKGGIGFARGAARVELVEQDDGGTQMAYHAELQIGGKIAGVGQRLLDSASKTMTRQGLEAVNRELQARITGKPAAVPLGARRMPWVIGVLLVVALVFFVCGPRIG